MPNTLINNSVTFRTVNVPSNIEHVVIWFYVQRVHNITDTKMKSQYFLQGACLLILFPLVICNCSPSFPKCDPKALKGIQIFQSGAGIPQNILEIVSILVSKINYLNLSNFQIFYMKCLPNLFSKILFS